MAACICYSLTLTLAHPSQSPHTKAPSKWSHPHFPHGDFCQERISDSTKEQRGRCRTRNNGRGDHQCKALVKCCRERTRARGSVSSQEKGHTNRNLARATAKP